MEPHAALRTMKGRILKYGHAYDLYMKGREFDAGDVMCEALRAVRKDSKCTDGLESIPLFIVLFNKIISRSPIVSKWIHEEMDSGESTCIE